MMTRPHQRLIGLLVFSILFAGCGSVTARTGAAATPTATLAPTATPSPTPPPTVTQEQLKAACPKGVGIMSSGAIYHMGDMYVAISLPDANFAATKLPDGTSLKPFNLNGLPSTPQ